jgi:ubiquinone/menaquinone biosynthesis C-methylase UbiE
VKAYYEARAREYDDWWLGERLYADRDRPGWEEEREALIATIAALPPKRTLDVACGTGFLTRHLQGEVTGLDQSETMCELAGRFVPTVCADALPLPFPDGAFERVFTSHFYGHLEEDERVRFLAEARRVADELVVVDSSRAHVGKDVERQPRVLNDGSRWEVYKRWFTADGLAHELGGETEALFAAHWFVAVAAR